MGVEIERKYLLFSEAWRKDVISSVAMEQGYLCENGTTVRVRLAGEKAFLTLKGSASGLVRTEYEYPIPPADARYMLDNMCVGTNVKKIRHIVDAGNGLKWEIDEYLEENFPLFTAEIELPAADTAFEIPAWLGKEVSGDPSYTNRALSRNPFCRRIL